MLNSACVAAFFSTSGSGVKSPSAASKTGRETPAAFAVGQKELTHCAGVCAASAAVPSMARASIAKASTYTATG